MEGQVAWAKGEEGGKERGEAMGKEDRVGGWEEEG